MKKTENILKIIKILIQQKKMRVYEFDKNIIMLQTGFNRRKLNLYLKDIEQAGLIKLKREYKKNKYKILILF